MKKSIQLVKLQLVILVLLCSNLAFAEYIPKDTLIFSNPDIKYKEWFMNGVRRQAGLYVPSTIPPEGVPLIIMWHGRNNLIEAFMTNLMSMHTAWPEAMVIYPQGLVVDPGSTKNGTGWKVDQDDLDLLDTILVSLKKEYKIDESRIYTSGFSNGGMLTYFLWEKRADIFAAFAPVAGFSFNPDKLAPKPFIQVAGEKDTTVPYSMQVNCVNSLKTRFNCSTTGTRFNDNPVCTEYKSTTEPDISIVTYYHGYAHVVPSAAPGDIVAFFKQHTKKTVTSIPTNTINYNISAYLDANNQRIVVSNIPKEAKTVKLIDVKGCNLIQKHASNDTIQIEIPQPQLSLYLVQVIMQNGGSSTVKVLQK